MKIKKFLLFFIHVLALFKIEEVLANAPYFLETVEPVSSYDVCLPFHINSQGSIVGILNQEQSTRSGIFVRRWNAPIDYLESIEFTLEDFPDEPVKLHFFVTAINDQDDVLGYVQSTHEHAPFLAAWLWKYESGFNAVNISINAPYTIAWDLNNRGEILGQAISAQFDKRYTFIQCHPQEWIISNEQMDVDCLAINDAGQMLGILRMDHQEQPIVWDYKLNFLTDVDPHLLSSDRYWSSFPSLLINHQGIVAGVSLQKKLFFWNKEQGIRYIDAFDENDEFIHIRAMNSHCQMVGVIYRKGVPHAFLWDEEKGLQDLTQLVNLEGWDLWMASDINDAGQIVGWGQFHHHLTGYILNPN